MLLRPRQKQFVERSVAALGEHGNMVDPTQQEKAAIRAAITPVAEIMEEIGWQARFCDLSETQVLTLIEVAVGGFQDAMRATAHSSDMEIPF